MDDNIANSPASSGQSSPSAATQDEKNLSLLMWLGTIFFGFIPPLVIYLVKKEDPYLHQQAKEALNWSITLIIGIVISSMLVVLLVGILLLPLLGLVNVVYCIMGMLKTMNGEAFQVPWTWRPIK